MKSHLQALHAHETVDECLVGSHHVGETLAFLIRLSSILWYKSLADCSENEAHSLTLADLLNLRISMLVYCIYLKL